MKKRERRNAPEIRFEGFEEDWEQRKFSNIVNRVSKQSNDANLPKVEFEDIISGEGRLNKDISKKLDDRKGIVFEPNFILFGKLRPYLKNWLLPNFKGIALGDFWVFESKNSSSIFTYYLIQTDKYQIVANLSSGTKMPRSDWKTVSEEEFRVPSIEEQTKIGNFFKQLDDTIALHQEKLNKLKLMKKGFLQVMFPQNEETEPQLRFTNFTSSWEQRKLGDISKNYEYGLNASATEYDGENKYIRITDIDDNSHKFLIDKVTSPDTDLSLAANYLLEEGDILFARTGASVGKTYIYDVQDGKVYYAGYLIRAKVKSEYDSQFIFLNTLTSKYYNFVKITSQRSGQPGINAKEYASFSILMPEKAEQVKIGNFFNQLDKTIALHQTKLEKLQSLKKAYLQKMFI
ncbi:restriction endonuclease subunit S [Terrilactibacillus laevilacticus]|uniref:restriction endonuclease subunit S n=1 Tax=Terrilactibacillus laevilacticus TaxID=1380157 RepID=UPI0011475E74|nr:restriction endonuclease subunit S [Terrilactibacillus laevilacticus]